MPVDHRQRSLSFGLAGCLRRIRLHDKTVPVLDQRMAHEVKLRGLALAFAEQLRIRVCLALVRVVGALFAVEIAGPVASGAGGSSLPSLARKLFKLAQASTSVPSTEK